MTWKFDLTTRTALASATAKLICSYLFRPTVRTVEVLYHLGIHVLLLFASGDYSLLLFENSYY